MSDAEDQADAAQRRVPEQSPLVDAPASAASKSSAGFLGKLFGR